MIKILITIPLLLLTPALAGALYGTTDKEFFDSTDRYAHPRSVEEYRRIVPQRDDIYGFCRSAGHIKQCLARLGQVGQQDDAAAQKTIPDITGDWRSLDVDDRKFHIERTADGWKMGAPDLEETFKITGVEPGDDRTAVVNVTFDSADEGTEARGHGQIKWFSSEGLLVVSEQVTWRNQMDWAHGKTLKRPETFVYSYKRQQP
jgi:hypothetical protein